MIDGISKAETIADVVRPHTLARVEARLYTRPRSTAAPRFHEHLARTPAEDTVAFSTFLRQQNREDRAAAKRLDWCPPCHIGRNLDVEG